MRNNRLHTPIGVRDLLTDECRLKNEITLRLNTVFKSFGYNEVISPVFEYIEVFSDEKMGSTNPKNMYKFFDNDGSTLALRSDMTPPVARISATVYSKEEEPLRFCYFGNVYKLN